MDRFAWSLLLVSSLLSISCSAATPVKPNVLIILVDDMGWNDVGYHGSDIRTPNIDALAHSGVRFERFYVTPICSPTRAGLLTGRYPDRFGLRREVVKPWGNYGLDANELTIADFLSRAGYTHRAAIGKWHLGHSQVKWHPISRGFTSFYGMYTGAIDYFRHLSVGERDWHRDFSPIHQEGYATELLGREAAEFLTARAAETNPDPWFLYLAFNAPHSPLQAETDDLRQYGFDSERDVIEDGSRIYGNPCCEQGRGNTRRQTYAAMMAALDREIGRVLDVLDRTNQAKNTLILFLSDNGGHENWGASNEPLRGGKHDVWEGGVRVPAIIRWPAAGLDGGAFSGIAAYIDILPTVASAAGIDLDGPAVIDGIDLLPGLRSGEQPGDRVLYLGARDSAQGYLVGGFAAVADRWKIVGEELFDLSVDEAEQIDVAAEYPEVAAELKEEVFMFRSIASQRKAPLAKEGKDDFEIPEDWRIGGHARPESSSSR